MSDDRSTLNRRRLRAGAIGTFLALAVSTATPTAAAISVDVTEEVCSFQISEPDARAATTAEHKLQEAVVLVLQQQFPELGSEIDYYHDRLGASTQDHGVRPHSGEVEHVEHRLDRAGRKAGFAAGELPRAIAKAAKAGDPPGAGTALARQAEHMQWHKEQATAFLAFQPRSNAELADYWPARSAGASQALIDLELEAARSIDFLGHLHSMNAAYRACAEGQSGEFPVAPPPREFSPAAINAQLATTTGDSEPAATILASDGVTGAPTQVKPAENTVAQTASGDHGRQVNSVVAVLAALVLGAVGLILRGRTQKTKP